VASVNDIQLTRTLRTQGFSYDDLNRLCRRGELTQIRRGAYAVPVGEDLVREAEHRRLIQATAPQLQPGSVVSHGSAAVLHQLPVWLASIERVHVTCSRSGNGKRRSLVHVHGAPLDATDVALVDGVAVTSLARTVLDLARTRPMEQAVAAGDVALRSGLPRRDLQLCLLRMERWPGVRRARQTVAFLDPRSESVGESVSRVRLHADGLPAPDLQQDILGPDERVIGRVDFLWKQQRTVGEFDGKKKYNELLEPGQSAEDVVYGEKLREDRLRDAGFQVARWSWQDLYRPRVIRDRVLRAFARSRS
jgi:hypothetical protein